MAPSGRCLVDSIIHGIGERSEYDMEYCDQQMNQASLLICTRAFRALEIPDLGLTFEAYANMCFSSSKFKANYGEGVELVTVRSLDEYAYFMRERCGTTNSVVMFPEAGILGHAFATMYNIIIEIYTPDLLIKEKYKPLGPPQSREPLVVALEYRFGNGTS
jgi:hypothetical protein